MKQQSIQISSNRRSRPKPRGRSPRRTLGSVPALGVLLAVMAGCGGGEQASTPAASGSAGGAATIDQIAAQRELTPDDVRAALLTYQPSGRIDDYVLFASGGHSGQVFVIGMPSMRLLRSIAVFTPEPWQGWGYGVGQDILEQGDVEGKPIRWGDTHHPALSETAGDYDGQWLFINDKANARIAVIDLRDFETKQIIKNPIALNDHGGTMVTPNTDYVIEGGQYATPLGWSYAPLSEYNESYRGMVTFWKFDREKGRIDPQRSFALELPPYWQDIFDAGKLVSEGWVFGNSINTELATGGIESGNAPFEAGASQRDADYLHIIDLKKAEMVFAAGKFEKVKDFPVISLQTCIDEGILFFAPEPKSPHGVDVAPKGDLIVVSGKLDPHVTIYSFEKIKKAIADKKWEPEQYGVPVLDLDAVVEARVEVGLGPLHTQFDDKGYAYTSLFLDTQVTRWTLGGDYSKLHPESAWTVAGKINVHYNVGHIATAEGDTVSPDGRYMVSMNKWSVDRFFTPGPLLPQNFQLIDIAQEGDKMQLLYDMPVGVGEPHYAQIIKADKLKPWNVYPQVGWDPHSQQVKADAPTAGKERIERDGNTVNVYMTAVRSHYNPEHVEVNEGDHVVWHITNVDRAQDATHGFAIPVYDINLSLEPGETATFEFTADQPGVFTYYCTEFCSALHLEMTGYLLVKPSQTALAQ
ncbi:MAG: Sec-dependent nitrous-oxide reductase [Phycisphaeraceae bacterium]|nr:Sec-dependent nitrous-oxide reductase [Phycisphaeraceae bacterium]